MQSTYAIISNMQSTLKFMAYDGKSQSELISYYTEQILPVINRQYSNGRYVYTVSERGQVSGAYHATLALLADMLTEFGYWYDGKFYSTHKYTKHATTSDLRELLPCQAWADILEHGIYYSDSLNVWFKG